MNNKSTYKKFDIALIICPPWSFNNPPVGLGYLSSYLISKGFKAKIIDLNIKLYNEVNNEMKSLWNIENAFNWRQEELFDFLKSNLNKNIDECINEILKIDTNVFGFSTMDPNERFTMEIIKRIKKVRPNLEIILGGPSCWSQDSRNIFSPVYDLIDGFVVGEGEYTLRNILENIRKNKTLEGIPGLLLSKNESSYIKRPFIEDLDNINFPTYSDFNLGDYHDNSLILLWSRGCMGNCVYCKEKSLWGESRYRSPSDVVEEIKYHVEKNKIIKFTVHDSAINWNVKWLEGICDLIIDSELRINWSAQAIPNFLSEKLLKKFKKAGCHTLVYGIESGSDKILRRMKKAFTSDKAEEVLKSTYKAKIKPAINIMVGFPGEGENELNQTIGFLKRNKNFINRIDGLSSLQVVIDTELYRNSKRYDIILPHIDEYNKWYSLDGNNFNERIKRLELINSTAEQLNIPIVRNFLYEETQSKKKSNLKKLKQILPDLKMSSLKILMVHPHDLFDNSEPWTVRITNIAEQFVNKGHKVKLIYFPLDSSKAIAGFRPEGFEAIPFCRACGPRNLIYNTYKIYRIIDWTDIVHFQKCFYYTSIPVILAAWARKKPIHYDWDDWETKIFYYGKVQFWRRPVGVFMAILERFIPKLVDTISVSSQKLYELCLNYGIPKDRICKAPVGADLSMFNPKVDKNRIRQQYNISGKLILYLGQLHGGQYAELFLYATKMILEDYNEENVSFMVVGGGWRLNELRQLSKNIGLNGNIIFTDFVSHSDVPEYLAAADICVACFEDNDVTRCKSPLKIVEYLASGKAIVASDVGEVRDMVGGVGLLVKAGNVKALANGIIKLLKDEWLRKEMGRRSRQRAKEKYNWETTASNLLDTYKKNFR